MRVALIEIEEGDPPFHAGGHVDLPATDGPDVCNAIRDFARIFLGAIENVYCYKTARQLEFGYRKSRGGKRCSDQ